MSTVDDDDDGAADDGVLEFKPHYSYVCGLRWVLSMFEIHTGIWYHTCHVKDRYVDFVHILYTCLPGITVQHVLETCLDSIAIC